MGKATSKKNPRLKALEEQLGGNTVQMLDRLMREVIRARMAASDALRRLRTNSDEQALEEFRRARQAVLHHRQRLLRVLEAHAESC
jgi:hypothetical protein|uniref:Uncharacterized protein n=1 Tax=Chloracidobacterium thermophilum TaxID=458033 RepID=A8DJW0_9BACT|nr:hypothetical protein YS_M60-F11.203 [Chloracidobacterium thermophilum]